MVHKKHKIVWGILAFFSIFALSALAIMLLWNALIPALFGAPILSYWQALGIMVLARLLLGGFGLHKFGHCWHHHHSHHHKDWEKLHDQFHSMSHKERKELILRRFAGHGFCGKENEETSDSATEEKE